ncbi:MAG: hypothetical protein JWP26_3702 [Devosia sp.]|uniref:hypothetical protein n=1 Tax=Devosia sp. TaxID=1871048 RepID=UPI00263507A9|nr:hypothetical protein [Devosia sp.]MDB5588732.1 hypothetical protein [Devosia sp.]
MKKLLAIVLVVAAVGLFLLFQASITSISLLGYSLPYGDVARNYLHETPIYIGNRSGDEKKPFCGSVTIQAELNKNPVDMVCVPLKSSEISPEGCDAVDTGQAVPNYIFPYHDTIVANVAVTVDNVRDVANYVETSSARVLQELGGDYSSRNMLSQPKKITVLQCSGYGIISIEQSSLANYLKINLP